MSKITDVRFVEIKRFAGERGVLSVLQAQMGWRRVFWIDMLKGYKRGGHAHRKCIQVLTAQTGSAMVSLSDSLCTIHEVISYDSKTAIVVPPMIWVSIDALEDNTMITVMASDEYDETDYIRDKSVWIGEIG